MKLAELDATFVHSYHARGFRRSANRHRFGAQGVLFQCPACAQGKVRRRTHVEGAHYVLVWFANPLGAPLVPPKAEPVSRWTAEGNGLDDLTLSPSVNLDVGPNPGCRWHGWVRSGDAA